MTPPMRASVPAGGRAFLMVRYLRREGHTVRLTHVPMRVKTASIRRPDQSRPSRLTLDEFGAECIVFVFF